jgi:hypothetical protein
MSTFAGHNLVRVSDVRVMDPFQAKSLNNILPPAKAAATAIPGFQRCASAEGSNGWVPQEEHLAHRHGMRRANSVPFMLKPMSSFDVARLDDKRRDAHFTPLSSAVASAAFTPAASSSSFDAIRPRSSSSYFGRRSSFSSTGRAPSDIAAVLAEFFPPRG